MISKLYLSKDFFLKTPWVEKVIKPIISPCFLKKITREGLLNSKPGFEIELFPWAAL
jgi:hypothetical protein